VLGGVLALAAAATITLLILPRPEPVDVATARRGPISETVADQGSARVREAYVVSSPVSGRLERVGLRVGDRVDAGRTLIARIRPPNPDLLDPRARSQALAAQGAASAAVSAAIAQRDQLRADAARIEGDLSRAAALHRRGFASQQALDAAEAQARVSRAALRAAEAQLEVRRSELRSAQAALLAPGAASEGVVDVRSPASGDVTRVLQESERTVTAGAPLVEVSDRSGLEASIDFLSQDAVRIREGMPAVIYDWGGGRELPAIVRRVEPQAFTRVSALGIEEQRVAVLLQLTGQPSAWARLGPGYRVWGRVTLRTSPRALKVPLGALVRADRQWAVFRVVDGRARLTPIEVGALNDREAEVLGGLTDGARVVVFPSDRVRDGAAVTARTR
jgi:HlyD family secretion protein